LSLLAHKDGGTRQVFLEFNFHPGIQVMPSNGELSILGLIKTILPDGTTRARSWDGICDWPPDLFAAVATITERSGLYAEPIFTAYWKKRQFALSPTWIRKTRALGKDWAELGTPL
jgi:hypothetical protein